MYNDPNQPQPPPYEQPGQAEPPYPQPPYGQPPPQWGQQPPPQYNPAQYGAPPNYNYMPPPNYASPPKKSRRWLWITLAIIGGILVLGCVVCGVLAATGIGFFAKVAQPALVATEYYTAIKNQNYSQAYTYLDTSSVTVQGQQASEALFTTAAQAVDQQRGTVSNFSIVPNTNDPSTVSVTVTRARSSPYVVNLRLKQEGNNWKIISADGI